MGFSDNFVRPVAVSPVAVKKVVSAKCLTPTTVRTSSDEAMIESRKTPSRSMIAQKLSLAPLDDEASVATNYVPPSPLQFAPVLSPKTPRSHIDPPGEKQTKMFKRDLELKPVLDPPGEKQTKLSSRKNLEYTPSQGALDKEATDKHTALSPSRFMGPRPPSPVRKIGSQMSWGNLDSMIVAPRKRPQKNLSPKPRRQSLATKSSDSWRSLSKSMSPRKKENNRPKGMRKTISVSTLQTTDKEPTRSKSPDQRFIEQLLESTSQKKKSPSKPTRVSLGSHLAANSKDVDETMSTEFTVSSVRSSGVLGLLKKTTSIHSLCSALETAAVDTSTPAAAEIAARSISPQRLASPQRPQRDGSPLRTSSPQRLRRQPSERQCRESPRRSQVSREVFEKDPSIRRMFGSANTTKPTEMKQLSEKRDNTTSPQRRRSKPANEKQNSERSFLRPRSPRRSHEKQNSERSFLRALSPRRLMNLVDSKQKSERQLPKSPRRIGKTIGSSSHHPRGSAANTSPKTGRRRLSNLQGPPRAGNEVTKELVKQNSFSVHSHSSRVSAHRRSGNHQGPPITGNVYAKELIKQNSVFSVQSAATAPFNPNKSVPQSPHKPRRASLSNAPPKKTSITDRKDYCRSQSLQMLDSPRRKLKSLADAIGAYDEIVLNEEQ